jgi:hypothetical protein
MKPLIRKSTCNPLHWACSGGGQYAWGTSPENAYVRWFMKHHPVWKPRHNPSDTLVFRDGRELPLPGQPPKYNMKIVNCVNAENECAQMSCQ